MEGILGTLHDRNAKFLEDHGILLFVVNRAGIINYVNKNIKDVLHYTAEQLIGKNIFRFVELNDENDLKNILKQDLKEDVELKSLSLFCSKCMGHFFDGVATRYSEEDDDQVILYLHNVTERKIKEDQLLKKNSDLENFTYKVSHDLKSPLRSIGGLISLIREDEKELPTYLELMEESLNRLNRYISDMADYSRRGVESEISRIDMEQLVEDIRSNFKFIPEAIAIRFTPSFDLRMPVYSDYLRLQMILNNLLSNAIKYHYLNQEDPFVELNVISTETELSIEVKDNGIGIPEDKLSLIFEKFQRATDRTEGTGIGLHIVKKAVQKLDGTIEVQSEVNQGTVFTITLPNMIPQQERRPEMSLAGK